VNAPVSQTLCGLGNELALNGTCSYYMEGNNIRVDVQEIANKRDAGNTSGTLALELWALEAPYLNENFSGYRLASMNLGEVQGRHSIFNGSYSLIINQPPAGSWHLVLMLREWGQGGYITRDFVNFPQRIKSQYKLMLSLDDMPVAFSSR